MAHSRNGTVNSNILQDVIFVDEDGNPIEPGAENLIYVDINGDEIPDEIAVELLKSGEYIDSRELFQQNDTTSFISQSNNNLNNVNNTSVSLSNVTLSKLNSEVEIKSELKGSSNKVTQASASSLSRRQQQPPPQKPESNSRSQVNLSKTKSQIKESVAATGVKSAAPVTNVDDEQVQQEMFQQKILELQNLIQEKQAELAVTAAVVPNESSHKLNKVPSQNLPQEQIPQQKSLSSKILPPAQSIGKQSAFSVVHHQLKAQPQEVQSVVSQPSQESLKTPVSSPVTVQQVAAIILQELPLQPANVMHQPDLKLSKSNASVATVTAETSKPQPKVAEQAKMKSSSSVSLKKSVSNVTKQVPQSVPEKKPNVSRSTSSSQFKVPEGYVLYKPQYLGTLEGSNGNLNIQLLQSIVDKHSKPVEFPDTHLEDIDYNAFVDPFTSNLFQDEIVEIDYGCIDAYTGALGSSQIDINSKGPQNDLKVNSRILEGKFSSFLDNQLLLGDYIDNGYSFTSFDQFNQEYQNRNLNKTSSSVINNSNQAAKSSSSKILA